MPEPQQIQVTVNLSDAPPLEPHEWDPANLGEPVTLPLFTFVRLSDAALLGALLLWGWVEWRGLHGRIHPVLIYCWFSLVVILVLRIPRYQGLPLPRWVLLWAEHARLCLRAPSMWGDVDWRGSSVRGRRFTAVLPPEVGRAIHANIQIGARGLVDVAARVGGVPQDILDLAIQALGKERWRALFELTMMGDVSTQSPAALRGMWSEKLALWVNVRWPFSLHVRTRPYPRHRLEVAAGPAWREAGELAEDLVQRRLFMAVYGGTVEVVRRRLVELTGTDRGGRLVQGGYGYRLLEQADIEELADDAYGKRRAPALGIAPGCVELRTGSSDPAPILPDSDVQRVAGQRTYVTLVAKGPPDHKVTVGWMRTAMQGRAQADWGIHVSPVPRFLGTNALLLLKAAWWETMPMAPSSWKDRARRAHRHLALLSERATATLRVGIAVSTPESQFEDTRSALEDMFGRDMLMVPLLRQREARMSAEAFGRDALDVHFETDAQTMAAMGPPSGGVDVPDGILFATANESPEAILYDPWFEHDDAPVCLFIGKSGSGKTNAQMEIIACILEPHPEHLLAREGPVPVLVLYFKPLDEWEAFTVRFRGRHFHPGGDSGTTAEEVLADAERLLGVAPIVAINLMDLDEDEQADFVRRMTARAMRYQRRQGQNFRKRFAYVIGEARVLTRTHKGALQLSTLANQARALFMWLCVDTQFVDHLLNSPADDVRRNAGMVLLMRLDDGERVLVKEKFGLSDAAFDKLTALAKPNTLAGSQPVRGMFVGRVHGVWVYGMVERLGELARLGDQTSPGKREDPLVFEPRERKQVALAADD